MPPAWKLPGVASRLSSVAGESPSCVKPLKEEPHSGEDLGSRRQPKAENLELIGLVLPNKAKKLPAVWMDWNLKIGILEIH